jgi:hypothetical protein
MSGEGMSRHSSHRTSFVASSASPSPGYMHMMTSGIRRHSNDQLPFILGASA